MDDLQRVIDDAKPMLEQFLIDAGFQQAGYPLDFPRLLDPFSRWLAAQALTEDDHSFLAARLGAFICEYLIAVHSGQRVIERGRILMRVQIQEEVLREFDPYEVAIGLVTNRNNLETFLNTLCGGQYSP